MAEQEKPEAEAPEPRQSLREVAEAAYDEVVEISGDDDSESPSGQTERQRDKYGRFVAADQAMDSGEAEAETPPSPDDKQSQQPEQPHPAPETGVAAQAPANWSAEARERFQKLPPEDQNFLLQRHHEMESDYQRRVQATAYSNQFVQAVTPVFNDPDIAESLRQEGRSPIEAVYQWAGFHKRALSPDLNTRVTLLFDLANRMQIDPAAVFGLSATPVTGLSPEDMANPVVKTLADQIGQLSARIQTQEAEYNRRIEAEQNALVGSKRAEIDAFADQRNADGSPAHPLFDHFLPLIMEHYRSNPNLSMAEAYERATRPAREAYAAQARAQATQQSSVQRAQTAVRGNTRGMTAPVSRPAFNGAKRSIRQVLEDSADEVGF
jgi:hypothetical protein